MNKQTCQIIRGLAANLVSIQKPVLDHKDYVNHYRRMKRAYIRSGYKASAILNYVSKAANALALNLDLNKLMVQAKPLGKIN